MQVTRSGNLAGAYAPTTNTGQPSGNNQASSLRYFHHDHLGSIAAVSDEAGTVIERMAYDPWGKRRYPNGLPGSYDAINGLTTDRGYTMHEHLDEMEVVHMNGRIYDPLIGRFMSADPFIQAPENLQSYNRYSYVFNNALAFTDPSGYFSWKKFWKKVLRPIVAIVVAYYTGQWVGWHAMAVPGITSAQVGIVSGIAGGFAGGLVASGGDIKAALQGALTGGLFGAAGSIGEATSAARYAAHAVAGSSARLLVAASAVLVQSVGCLESSRPITSGLRTQRLILRRRLLRAA
jgi:RHS repeat-associated protein